VGFLKNNFDIFNVEERQKHILKPILVKGVARYGWMKLNALDLRVP
jgi:hypothetical protein